MKLVFAPDSFKGSLSALEAARLLDSAARACFGGEIEPLLLPMADGGEGTVYEHMKRILDFSFGVASALDANVECVGNKVFALTRIDELTEAERSYLRTQGII